MATKSSPRTTVRELIETPANRARGARPPGGVTPKAPATSSTVHRIASSRGWVSLVSDLPWISVPYVKEHVPCRIFEILQAPSFRSASGKRADARLKAGAATAFNPHSRPCSGPGEPLRNRQIRWCGRAAPASFHAPCRPAAQCLPRGPDPEPPLWPSDDQPL